jgi:GNAT superfamily N-acetyltransferase
MSEHLPVHIRPARESDTPEVMELTSQIWNGHDYVQFVWAEWLADRNGRLLVAEHQGSVLGLGKLTRISEEDWWLQGLRVHPEFQGRGIATQITEALVETWRAQGSGAVRLATHSQRLPVHRLCARLGFTKASEITVFVASTALEETPDLSAPRQEFHPLSASEAESAADLAMNSASLALVNGLMDLSWKWAPPRPVYLRRTIEREQAWWWRGGQGLLAIYIDQDEDEPARPYLELAACEIDMLAPLLMDYRRLAAALGYQQAAWNAALHPGLLPILQMAGFQRDWEHALFVYSKS